MSHPIIHAEFATHDRPVLAQFYADLFGWSYQHVDEMNYTTVNTGENSLTVGLNPISDDYPAGTVTVYIATDSVAGTLAKVEAQGGTTLIPESEIPGVGHFGMFRDPAGNQVGLLNYFEQPG